VLAKATLSRYSGSNLVLLKQNRSHVVIFKEMTSNDTVFKEKSPIDNGNQFAFGINHSLQWLRSAEKAALQLL